MIAWLCAGVVFAEEPPAMQFDTLLVTPFRAAPGFEAEARSFRDELVRGLEKRWTLTDITAVPAFEDYDAATYLAACPLERYSGCALVIGQRAPVDWVVAGEVGPSGPLTELHVSFIDTRGSTELFSIGLGVGEGRDPAVAAAVATLLDKVVAGAFDAREIRELPTDDPVARKAAEDARDAAVAESLDALEREVGAVSRGETREIAPVRLTMEDLAGWRESEGVTPWDQAGLTERQYVRYRNSGLDLAAWRRQIAGRAGRILLRFEAGYGIGPWGQSYQGFIARDESLAVVETLQYHEIASQPAGLLGLEVGLGVLPFLEIAGAAHLRPGRFEYDFDTATEGETVPISQEPIRQSLTAFTFGGGATLAPFPSLVARPTFGLAVAGWSGKGFAPPDPGLDATEAPNQLLLEPSIGAEGRASDRAVVFARFVGELAVAGTRRFVHEEGASSVAPSAVPLGNPPPGWNVRVGVQAWVWPDGTVARYLRFQGRNPSEDHRFDRAGIPWVTLALEKGLPQTAVVHQWPPVELDLRTWTTAAIGPAEVRGPGPASDGRWATPAGLLRAAWLPGAVEPASAAFAEGVAEGCGCLLSERTAVLADNRAGVGWRLDAPDLDAPEIGELWAFPLEGGVLVLGWTAARSADPVHPELAPGRAALAALRWTTGR
jgi:hypothetical protein